MCILEFSSSELSKITVYSLKTENYQYNIIAFVQLKMKFKKMQEKNLNKDLYKFTCIYKDLYEFMNRDVTGSEKKRRKSNKLGVCTDLSTDNFDFGRQETGVPHVWDRRRTR